MENLKFKFFCSFIFTLLLLPSCIKEHEKTLSPNDVIVTINAPLNTQEYEAGDTVFIKIDIASPSEIHGYELHVLRLADTTEIINIDKDAHQSHYTINEYFVNEGKVHSDMELTIKAHVDDNGSVKTGNVRFHCHEK